MEVNGMKNRNEKKSSVHHKGRQSHITLLLLLLLLNLALMATSAWSKRNSSDNARAIAQVQAPVQVLPIREREADERWADLILKPLRRLYMVIGLIPLVLIGIAARKHRVRDPLTWVSYGTVLIILTVTLAITSYFADLAGLSVLTDQAYLRFSRQNDFMRGFLTWLPGSFGLALLVVGLRMRPRQHA